MNKLLTLRSELEGRLEWLDKRLELNDVWSDKTQTYFLTRKRTFEQIIKRIDELESM